MESQENYIKKSMLSPAKLNLSLFVTGKTKDDYHKLHTLFQKISLYDRVDVRLQKSKSSKIVVFVKGHPELSSKNNICYKAAELLLQKAKKNIVLIITIDKKIPISAGLGGGSSNAASTLILLNEALRLNWSTRKLIKIGRKIGADVPLFIKKGWTFIGRNKGDKLEKVKLKKKIYYAIYTPRIKISTEEVFKKYSRTKNVINKKTGKIIDQTIAKSRNVEKMSSLLHNDLLKSAVGLNPKLKLLLKRYKNAKLTGSGSTIFIPFNSHAEASSFVKKDKKWKLVEGLR